MPTESKAFIDSNIVLYALGKTSLKQHVSWGLLFQRPVISVQVLNECSNTLIKKKLIEKSLVKSTLQDILRFASVESINLLVVETAWSLLERYGYSYYDSLILASALTANCQVLYSEDMQQGQIIDHRMTILNPFFASVSS